MPSLKDRLVVKSAALLALLALSRLPLPAAAPAAARSGAPSLEEDVRWIVTHQYGFKLRNVSVAVIDSRGRRRVAINAARPFKPASNMKIITSAAALELLGENYLFETQVLSTSPLTGHEITGDIILRGTGDPNISGQFYDRDVTVLLKRWAGELHAYGLRRVRGDLVVDDSFFDGVRFLPTWDRSQEGRGYSAQISALSLNENCVDITIRPSRRPGRQAQVNVVPVCAVVKVHGAPKTTAGRKRSITIHRKTGTNDIAIGGSIGHRSETFSDRVTVDDPAIFFGSVLREVLATEGIEVAGEVRRVAPGEGYYHSHSSARKPSRNGRHGADGVRASEHRLVRHTSSLKQDLPLINKHSRNLHAEIVLKSLGARVLGQGSVEGGERAIRLFLEERGLGTQVLKVHDGSGLSHLNRVSADLLARVLRSVMSEPYFETFRKSLAIAGVDGTLQHRFRQSKDLHGRVYAKTGSIAGVSALSGYLVRGSKTWCFAVLVNGFSKGAKSPSGLQESILVQLDRAMR